MKIKTDSAFTLIEIMIVVAIIGLLAAIAIPNFGRARSEAQKNTCISNLHMIDGAKQEWALETHVTNRTAVPTKDQIGLYMKQDGNTYFPYCPLDQDAKFETSYSITAIESAPICLIWGDDGKFTNSSREVRNYVHRLPN